jgi:hypothetical protein
LNKRFVPERAVPSTQHVRDTAAPTAAVVTASYAPDFERCRLLCETMDEFVTGAAHHYILVESRDVRLFRQLETASRTVVDEHDLLPSWLHAWWDPSSLFRRRIWLSFKTQPLRGWHVQQLRRMAIGAHVGEDTLVYCDSDVVFLKPFDCGAFWHDGAARLFRRDDALLKPLLAGDHHAWSRNAGLALGISTPESSLHDYIATLIAWRRDTLVGLCNRIEEVHGRHWVETIGRTRQFSECILYGRYADEVLGGAGHFHDDHEFCRVYWAGNAMSDDEFRDFVDGMAPEQVAIGMQSFIGTDLSRIRRLISRK